MHFQNGDTTFEVPPNALVFHEANMAQIEDFPFKGGFELSNSEENLCEAIKES